MLRRWLSAPLRPAAPGTPPAGGTAPRPPAPAADESPDARWAELLSEHFQLLDIAGSGGFSNVCVSPAASGLD